MIGYQLLDHLPVRPTRLYYELSLHWVFWYLGLPAVALATVGAVVLARRCAQGTAPEWVLPLLPFGWIVVATLPRPAITPDQPSGSAGASSPACCLASSCLRSGQWPG